MIVTNGIGYNALSAAYSRGEISPRTEIIVDFKKRRFFDNYIPKSHSIAFDKKGILCFVQDGKNPSIGGALKLEDLTRIDAWGFSFKGVLKRTPITV